MRKLFEMSGDPGAYNKLLDNIYRDMSEAERREYDEYPGGKENESELEHQRRVADEWLARGAEDVNLEGSRSLWQAIKTHVKDWMRRHGMDIYYSDYELEDLIRRSYKRLSGSADGGGRDGAPARLTDGGEGRRFRFTEDKEDFDKMLKEAAEKDGIVMPSLAEKEVKVVHGDINHPFDTSLPDTSLKKQVKSYAREHSDEMLGDIPVENGIVNVSLTSLGEMADPKSYKNTVKNGVSKDVHFAAIPKIKEIIRNSIDAEVHPDYIERDKSGKRIVGKYSDHILMHRLYGAVEIDGKVYRVKTTVKEDITNKTNRAHTYEVAEIELLESHTRPADSTSPISNNSISGANLLQGVEKSYDSGKKLLDESAKTTDSGSRDAEYAAAVAAGDAEKVDRMLREEAGRKSYHAQEDYHDAHYAPYASVERGKFTDVDALREAVEVNGDDPNLFAIANGISNQPDDYWSQRGPRLYMYNDQAGYETYAEIGAAIRGIQYQLRTYGEVRDMPLVKVYRAVPEDIKGEQLETYGQWVSPSRTYAEKHGKHRFGEGAYRIIEQEVPADQLWWDGNDAREWGYDDGSRADVYKNTANNRKLLEATYDDAGKLIPLSQRFDEGKSDVRFRVKGDDERRPTFYSNAERAVEGVKQERATGEQWKAMLTKAGGIKAGEDKWMGLSDWFDEHRGEKLTKAEVLQFVRGNGIRMEEVNYGGDEQDRWRRIWDGLSWNELYDTAVRRIEERGGDSEEWDYINDEIQDILTERYGEQVLDHISYDSEGNIELKGNEIHSIREDLTTPGLENKREIAFVVPGVEPYQKNDAVHFGPENEGRAVMWVRFGETRDTDGKRVLVIDEVQSNRHQDAREEGYVPKRFDDISKERLLLNREIVKLHSKLYGDGLSEEEYNERKRLIERDNELAKEQEQMLPHGRQDRIPAAPFEKNWHEVAMKRMLRLAADEGFDKVAWTTGEQQTKRYNLGGKVDSIYIGQSREGADKYNVTTYDADTNAIPAASGHYTEGEMEQLFGKGITRQLIDGLNEQGERIGNRYLQYHVDGVDLDIGSEGMKGFYDDMLPRFMNKYGKKWGAKVGEVELSTPGREVMHSVDVTDAMKESVSQGQPLFRIVDKMSDIEREKVRVSLEESDAIEARPKFIMAHDGKSARTVAMEWVKSNLPHPISVDTEVGELVINQRSIKDSLAHGFSQAKLDAIPTLVPAFEKKLAVYIGSGEDKNGNPITDHYFAYPINYDGSRDYVFCRTREDQKTHRLYIHEVMTKQDMKEGQTLQNTALEKPRTGLPLYRKILASIFDGKDNTKISPDQTDGAKTTGNGTLFRVADEHSGAVEDARRRLEDPNASEFEKQAARAVIKAYGGGNDGTAGGGVRYRYSDRDVASAQNDYEREVRKSGFQVTEAIQDSMASLKKLMQAIPPNPMKYSLYPPWWGLLLTSIPTFAPSRGW